MREKIISSSKKKRKKLDGLIEDAIAIEAEYAKENGKIGYQVNQLVQVTLPHKDPGILEKWGRRNGDLSMVIQAGAYVGQDNKTYSYGLPYGPKPRLIMAYIATEAVKTQSNKIYLGNNLSQFMQKLDLDVKGGKGGTIAVVKEQMTRLLSSTITFSEKVVEKDTTKYIEKGFKISEQTIICWKPIYVLPGKIWETEITLSTLLFNEIIKNPIPLHLDVLGALKGSSMELDIYTWLPYRMSYLSRPTEIPWELLAYQFGSEYSRIRAFKENFLKHLNIVLGFYPANVEPGKRGLILNPSRTHIKK